MSCIVIGEYKICINSDDTVWIEMSDGEGSEFNKSEVEAVIKKFYDDNF